MRLFKHLFATPARRLFPTDSLARIAAAIAAGEARHTGEIRFAVESALHPRAVLAGLHARDRALEVFSQLRVWDTQANNGVLVYLLLADHRIEIVADRGFDGLVGQEQWRSACQRIEEGLKAGEPETAVVRGIQAVSALIERHFPRDAGSADLNELPDDPHLL